MRCTAPHESRLLRSCSTRCTTRRSSFQSQLTLRTSDPQSITAHWENDARAPLSWRRCLFWEEVLHSCDAGGHSHSRTPDADIWRQRKRRHSITWRSCGGDARESLIAKALQFRFVVRSMNVTHQSSQYSCLFLKAYVMTYSSVELEVVPPICTFVDGPPARCLQSVSRL